ncbi:hypothetical protein EVAR_43073_1 [Eumeta japonica]|uniref:Uncharacterized protein n=1 Tax=Eumeta variegata TaxID=151549 RepID=A0A4C1WYZ9_EUMVA|nr:hypothetical protein EVAR_43073_1 [Eumeta japonica]
MPNWDCEASGLIVRLVCCPKNFLCLASSLRRRIRLLVVYGNENFWQALDKIPFSIAAPLCNLTAQQSLGRLRIAFGDEANVFIIRFTEFEGRPSTALNNKNVDAVRCMIETDRHVTSYRIRASLSIRMSQIHSNLHTYLGMKKLCRGESHTI